MAKIPTKIHMSECGSLVTSCYGGLVYASKHHNSINEEDIAFYKTFGDVIFNRIPPLEITNLFKAGYVEVMHSIDDVIYLYKKNGAWY